VLRKLALFALFGFLAIVLAGPFLAILAVVLSFALVAFLLWVPLYALFADKQAGLRHAQAIWHEACRVGRDAMHGLLNFCRDLGPRAHATVTIIAAVMVETLSGAVVGGFLVYLSEGEHPFPSLAVAAGALVGSLAGLLVVFSRWHKGREQAMRKAADLSE
jgi:hypothetical protein